MREIIAVLVKNEFGVLARVVDLFSARGFNIDSLNVAPMGDGQISRMTLIVSGEAKSLEQVRKQLSKLVDTLKVTEYSEKPCIKQELLVAKVSTSNEKQSDLFVLANAFQAQVLNGDKKSLTMRLADTPKRLDLFLSLLEPFGLIEMARSGPIVMGG